LTLNSYHVKAKSDQQLSMPRILHASCATALDAFRAADNPVDTQLVIDLEKMVERTRVELERFANSSWPGPRGKEVGGAG
jgi:hypothetical protein